MANELGTRVALDARHTNTRNACHNVIWYAPPPPSLSLEEQLAPRTNYAYLNVHINVERGRSSAWVWSTVQFADSRSLSFCLCLSLLWLYLCLSLSSLCLFLCLSVCLPVCLLCFLLLCARVFFFLWSEMAFESAQKHFRSAQFATR